MRTNKVRYAQAEASARARNPSRPPYFNLPFGIGMVEAGESEYAVEYVMGADMPVAKAK